jgi:site-specific recombinase XerD
VPLRPYEFRQFGEDLGLAHGDNIKYVIGGRQSIRSQVYPLSSRWFDDAVNKASSDDEFHAEVFCRHFGNKSLSEIDHQMIEKFKIKRMQSITRYGRTRKPASVNRELAILSGIFRMAVDYDEIPQNPCRKVQLLPENNQRTRHLSFEEEHRLFAEMTSEREYLRSLVTVAIYAPDRAAENY